MTLRLVIVAIVCGCMSAPVLAEEDQEAAMQFLPTVALLDVLDAVGKKTGHTFVIDSKVGAQIVIGQAQAKQMDYATLLVVLHNNGLAAVKYEGAVSIINVARVRQYPLPVLYEFDESYDEEEWVTMIIEVENAAATQFVPIMRPMLPQAGHMVGHPSSNMITIVDRYGNVKRVVELIRKMDRQSTQQ